MSNDRLESKKERLEQVASQVRDLEKSPLYAYRQEHDYQSVFGEGDPDADIMFIGEAPGKREALTGRPFVGAAGRILDELLDSIGLERDQVYITNVVKDRPPENRDPTIEEINLYQPFLSRQIQIIQPKVIATLGRFAMDFIFEYFDMHTQKECKISQVHGRVFQQQAEYGEIVVIPLYHPAVALYNKNQRGNLEQDFRTLEEYLSN
jgi:uracil-DNA glycosylase family 4